MLTLTFSIFRLAQNTSMNVFLLWLKSLFSVFLVPRESQSSFFDFAVRSKWKRKVPLISGAVQRFLSALVENTS